MQRILEDKHALRQKMLLKRKAIEEGYQISYGDLISERLIEYVKTNNVRIVHSFIPMKNEIDICRFIEYMLDANIKVVVPKTHKNRKLSHVILTSLNHLRKGLYGTQHPDSDIEYLGDFDLIVVPGLAFDNNNYRLGYGGGYYDEFLSQHPKAKKLGLAFPFQMVDIVPKEEHDVQLDGVVYELKVKHQKQRSGSLLL